jgi:hypothetical protein
MYTAQLKLQVSIAMIFLAHVLAKALKMLYSRYPTLSSNFPIFLTFSTRDNFGFFKGLNSFNPTNSK